MSTGGALEAFEASWIASDGLPEAVRSAVRGLLADAWPQDDDGHDVGWNTQGEEGWGD